MPQFSFSPKAPKCIKPSLGITLKNITPLNNF